MAAVVKQKRGISLEQQAKMQATKAANRAAKAAKAANAPTPGGGKANKG